MIVQNVSEDGTRTDMTFTVPAGDLAKATQVIEGAKAEMRFRRRPVRARPHQGLGDRHRHALAHPASPPRPSRRWRDGASNIRAITTSEIKISILIDGDYTELAVRTLHSVYGLDKA